LRMLFARRGMIKKFILYAFRWQLSSPILAACIIYLPFNSITKTIIANLLGALIFFFVDKWIFKPKGGLDTTKLLARVDEEVEVTRVPLIKLGMMRVRKIIEEVTHDELNRVGKDPCIECEGLSNCASKAGNEMEVDD
jgi:hypothetical protein